MTSADLLALAERCEQAAGADRELDGWVWAHMKRGERYVIGNKPGPFPQKPIYGERLDVMRKLTRDGVGAADYIGAPKFTASLDAAMTLLDPSWFFHLSRFSEGPPEKAANAHVYPNRALGDDYEADAATPALALTAAALRARAATMGGDK